MNRIGFFWPASDRVVWGNLYEERLRRLTEMPLETGTLRLLSPTDCVKDRLAAFYHWNDRQCLQQAVWVAQERKVDWKEVERWSMQEGEQDKFNVFHSKFQEEGITKNSKQ